MHRNIFVMKELATEYCTLIGGEKKKYPTREPGERKYKAKPGILIHAIMMGTIPSLNKPFTTESLMLIHTTPLSLQLEISESE